MLHHKNLIYRQLWPVKPPYISLLQQVSMSVVNFQHSGGFPAKNNGMNPSMLTVPLPYPDYQSNHNS
jgi:hypothetical protein